MLDAEWERLGRPDPFTVVEVGAGPGTPGSGAPRRRTRRLGGVALRGRRGQRRPAGPSSRVGRVGGGTAELDRRRRRGGQRVARQPAVPTGGLRRRMARGVRRRRRRRSLRRSLGPGARSATTACSRRSRRWGRGLRCSTRRSTWVTDVVAAARTGSGGRVRLRPLDHRRAGRVDRGGSGCARTPVISGAGTTSPSRVARTSRSTLRSTSSRHPTCGPDRPTGCGAGGSTSWWRRARRRGRRPRVGPTCER